MTIKIDIDKYTANSPLINKMLHMADSGKFGEAENNNGMIDTEKESNLFLKIAEKNKKLLAKHGYKVEGSGGIFSITRTNKENNAKTNFSVLTYDKKHDFIEEKTVAGDLTAKTTFNNNNDIQASLYDTKSGSFITNADNKGTISSMPLSFVNVLSFGGVSRALDTINQLSFVWRSKKD